MNSIIESDCRDILRRIDTKKLKNASVLITGASGFLGQYLAAALYQANKTQKLGVRVTCVSLHPPQGLLSKLRHDKNFTFQSIDLSREFSLSGSYDFIFHAAGYGQPAKFLSNPRGTIAINVAATGTLLEIAKKSNATMVFFSSAEIYGEIPASEIPAKESFNGNCPTTTPRAVYAESKRLGEALCAAYARDFSLPAKIVRISHLYGPGLPANDTRVMSDFIRKALVEKEITLLDEGKSIKTYGYIADAIAMILFVALDGREMIYNVGGRDRVSIRMLARKIGTLCHVSVKIPAARTREKHIGNDLPVMSIDLSKIRKEIKGFAFTHFETGLKRTVQWTRDILKRET